MQRMPGSELDWTSPRRRNSPSTRRWLIYLLLGGVALTNAGCVALAIGGLAAAGAAGYSYYAGKLQGDFPASVAQTEVAARTAIQDLGCVVYQTTPGFLEGRMPDGEKLAVYIDPSPDELVSPAGAPLPLTRVTVRVGMFGDDVFSEKVLDRVNYRLTQLPKASRIPAVPGPKRAPSPVIRKEPPLVFKNDPPPVPVWQPEKKVRPASGGPSETAPPPVAIKPTGPPPLSSEFGSSQTVPSSQRAPTTAEPPLAGPKQVQWTTGTSPKR
ncbi:MAG: DUF3568 family protein [Gemmataceae bacterium]